MLPAVHRLGLLQRAGGQHRPRDPEGQPRQRRPPPQVTRHQRPHTLRLSRPTAARDAGPSFGTGTKSQLLSKSFSKLNAIINLSCKWHYKSKKKT